MDLNVKVKRAQQAIASIAQHDDASKDEVEKALSEVVNFVADADENGLAGREERIQKRADVQNAKFASKQKLKKAE
jgi:hypothetical protein